MNTNNHQLRTVLFAMTMLAIELVATPQARATDYTSIIGDLANPRAAIDFGNPSYGYAQEFTITSSTWDIFQAQINLGDLDPMPGPPLLQVRNALGAGLGPGTTILGSFTMNPNDIPTGFNFANIVATADTSFTLGPGTYWFCLGNDQPIGCFCWVPFANDDSLVQGGLAGTVNTTAVAQSSDGGQTFGTPSLGGYALLFELDAQPVPKPAKYSGGTGGPTNPYKIGTVSDWNDLMNTSSDWDKHFILIADINLQGIALKPVGNFDIPFIGVFGGNSHIIRNAYINSPADDDIGLFGYIDTGSQIRNLGVEDVNMTGRYDVGGLVGFNGGDIATCYATGAVVSKGWFVGGLLGLNYGSVNACYAAVVVTGESVVGGLAGGNDEGSISACYATGTVSGRNFVGGLMGYNGGSVSGSFWDTQTSGQTTSSGGTGMTTAEMKTLSTFTSAGWNFVEIWGIGENQTYPYLRTEPAGDLNHDKKVDFEDFAILASHWLENWAGPSNSSIGLVAYYPFNGNANDASGKGNNGTVVGAAFETYGAGNTLALHFNGNTSSYVVVPRSASLEPVDAISISMWVKGVQGQACGYGWGTILRKADDCQPGYFIKGCNGGSSFWLCGANPCSGADYWTAGFPLFTGTSWQHIVATYSRTDGLMKSYENGVLVNQTPLASQLLHSGNLYIGGAAVRGDDGGFNGLINEVRIYNRALSASEVQQLYLSGSGSHP